MKAIVSYRLSQHCNGGIGDRAIVITYSLRSRSWQAIDSRLQITERIHVYLQYTHFPEKP